MSNKQRSRTLSERGDVTDTATADRARETKRLRILSKLLATLLAAILAHVAIDGADVTTVLSVALTAVLLAGSLWLAAKISGPPGP